MVSIDERLHETLAGVGGRWRPLTRRLAPRRVALRRLAPRWLVLPVALPLFLVFGLALGTLANLALTGGAGEQAGLVAPASAAAAERDGLVPPGSCARMRQIVDTACSLKQRDHDAGDIRQCVAHELKYTLWSAYGCQ